MKQQVQEFTSEDLGIEPEPESDEIRKIKDNIEKLYELFHQKGLDVGLPHLLLYDINAITTILDKMKNSWDDEQSREKEHLDDNEIEKIMNRGDVILAYHKKQMQVLRLREERIKMVTFLWVLREKLASFQGRIKGQEQISLESFGK